MEIKETKQHSDVIIRLKKGYETLTVVEKQELQSQVHRSHDKQQWLVVRSPTQIQRAVLRKLGLAMVPGPFTKDHNGLVFFYANSIAQRKWPKVIPSEPQNYLLKVKLHLFIQTEKTIFQVFINHGKKLDLVGGAVDASDADVLTALRRECLEETGLLLDSKQMVLECHQKPTQGYSCGGLHFQGKVSHFSAIVSLDQCPSWFPFLVDDKKYQVSSWTLRRAKIDPEVKALFFYPIRDLLELPQHGILASKMTKQVARRHLRK